MGVQPYLKPLFISCTFRITGLHYTYWCPAPSAAYDSKVYLQIHRITLDLWMPHLKFCVCLQILRTESISCTTPMGTPPQMQPMMVTSSLRITCLHNTYMCPTLSEAYVSMFYLQNHWAHYTYRCLALKLASGCQLPLQNNWVTVHLLMRHLQLTLCWLLLPSELPCFTLLMGVQVLSAPYDGYQQLFTRLHYTWVYNLKCSLCLYVLPTESLGILYLQVSSVTFSLSLSTSPTE